MLSLDGWMLEFLLDFRFEYLPPETLQYPDMLAELDFC